MNTYKKADNSEKPSGIKFDGKGMIILPESVKKFKEEQKKEEELMKTFKKKIKIRYIEPEYGKFITCIFEIELPEDLSGKEIIDNKNWADKNVKLKPTARAWIERSNPDEEPPTYRLKISGRGEDERCTWCRTFRTALRTNMIKKECAVIQDGCCDFEL